MFWWFARGSAYLRFEVLEAPQGEYELRIILEDGTMRCEHFRSAAALATRQRVVENQLKLEGWSGPHGWVM